MKRAILAVMVLALLAVPALAGQNPHIKIYLYTTSTGIGGTNHTTTPGAGSNKSVYVCLDNVWGGVYGVEWQFAEVPGPDFLSTTNQYAGVGGLTIGDPGIFPGCAMTLGPSPAYPTNGVIVVARIRYETPEELTRGGTITIIPYNGSSRAVQDADNQMDLWCVHSVAYDGLSGNFGWDDSAIPDGDCDIVPVAPTSWGAIKALYR